ncbi:MAG: DUF373 family protein [Euryarchaeota archaeon]|nr:DUF373 family protein [Euryarchaeota archaeon]
MKTLILTVDRDDDLGRKAKVKGPVIGREGCLDAGVSLALADPEDSDANAIFAAISTYDRLKKDGKDVEVAILTGHESVGMKSDEIITKQFSKVIDEVQPDDIIFVSDGSEDEFIIPIITSRRPIKHLRRVIVRQSKSIESTYYIIMKALKDKKIMRRVMMPIALIFLAYSMASIIIFLIRLSNPSWNLIDPGTFAWTIITLTLGLYFLERAYGIGDRLRGSIRLAKEAMLDAKVTVVGDTLAALIILAGLNFGYEAAQSSTNLVTQFMLFLHTFILWFVFAVMVREGGKTFDIWIHRGEYNKRFWIGLLSTLSLGIIIYALLDYILLLMNAISSTSLIPISMMVATGLIISFIAAMLHRKMRGVNDGDSGMDEPVPED